MKRRLITIGATLAFLFMALAERGLVRAETMEELSEKVKTQNALIQELIQKVKILERGGKSAAEENGDLGKLVRRVEVLEKVEAVSSSEPTEKGWVNSDMAGFLKDVQVNGYMDAAYGFNFNRPRSRKNSLRIFDVDDNSFTFNAAELVIQKPASEPGDVGFRADMVYGYGQSQITNSTGSFGDDEFDLHQAYISYVAPIGNGLTLDIGKWITHIGLEVIEGYDGYNDNYSRSFNFGLAIPFTHLGLRAAYPLRDDISLLAGIANGWDNVEDNNRSKLYFAQIGWAPLDKISFLLNYGGGKEQDDRESNWRNIFNVVTTVTPMEKLTLNFNYNYGTEEDVPGIDGTSTWQGFSGIARYEFNEWLALAIRGEFFNDDDGTRTGTRQNRLREFTVTPELRLNDNMVLRAEYRHDWGNKDVYEDRGGNYEDDQDTLAINFIYHF